MLRPIPELSLLAAMKNVGRRIEDKELAAHIGGGLGTPVEIQEIGPETLLIIAPKMPNQVGSKGNPVVGPVLEHRVPHDR